MLGEIEQRAVHRMLSLQKAGQWQRAAQVR